MEHNFRFSARLARLGLLAPLTRRELIEVTVEADGLHSFYAVLKRGTTVADFLDRYECVIEFIHKEGLTESYRLARGAVKKLRDEVTPIARFVRTHAAPKDRIWFALSASSPDCHVNHEGNGLREIEVTVAQARERLNVMTELNQTATGRGFLGLTDDAPTEDFVAKMAQPRVGYTDEEIGRSMIRAVEICAQKKSNYQGDTLLIEAPLETFPADRWNDFQPLLAEKAKELAFSEVYVTGVSDREICLRIK